MTFGKEYEKEQLDRILKFEKALTPEGRFRLRGKLREARALAKLLSKPPKKRTKEDKEDTQEYYSKLANSVRISQLGYRPTHQNMKAVGEEEHQLAKLVEASKVYSEHRYGGVPHEQAEKLTNEYINTQGEGHANLEGWKLNGDLTNKYGGEDNNYRGAIFEKGVEGNKKAFAAFRGTKFSPTPFGAEDLALDAEIVSSGKVPSHPQISQANQMVKEAVGAYGKKNVKTGGYSLGGFKGIHAGNQNGVDSITFNPLTQGNALLDDSVHPMGILHRIIRTPDDVASLNSGSLQAKYSNKYDIKSVGAHTDIKYGEGWKVPFTDIQTGFSPQNVKAYMEHPHKHINFIEDHKPRNEEHTALYRHMERAVNMHQKHHHLSRFKEMLEHNQGEENLPTLDDFETESRTAEDIMGGLRDTEGMGTPQSLVPKAEPLRQERLRARKGIPVQLPDEPDTLIDSRTRPAREEKLRSLGYDVDDPVPIERKLVLTKVPDPKSIELEQKKREYRFKEATDKRAELQKQFDELNERYNPETFNDEDWNKTAKERLEATKGTNREAIAKAQVKQVNRDLAEKSRLKSMLEKAAPKMEEGAFTEGQIDKYISRAMMPKVKLPPTTRDAPRPLNFGQPASNQRQRDEPFLDDFEPEPEPEPPKPKPIANIGEANIGGKMSFTDYANDRGVAESDKNKYLWEQSGGELTDAEKGGYDKPLGKADVGIDEPELEDFRGLGRSDRQNHLDNIENKTRGDFNFLEQAQNSAGRTSKGIFTDGLATGALRAAKGIAEFGKEGVKGFGFGLAGTAMRKYGEEQTGVKLNKTEANLADSTLAAGMYSRYLGTGAVKGGIAGFSSTAIGMGTEYGTTKGLEALGVSKKVAKPTGAATGGAASGASFIAISEAIGADAALGTELGIEGGPFGMAIGAVVGGVIGLGSYFMGK